jgi:hypothetical protein
VKEFAAKPVTWGRPFRVLCYDMEKNHGSALALIIDCGFNHRALRQTAMLNRFGSISAHAVK